MTNKLLGASPRLVKARESFAEAFVSESFCEICGSSAPMQRDVLLYDLREDWASHEDGCPYAQLLRAEEEAR